MWCFVLRGQIGESLDTTSDYNENITGRNPSASWKQRFASAVNEMGWTTTFNFFRTRGSIVGNRIGSSFRTSISNFGSERRRIGRSYVTNWRKLERSLVIEVREARDVQHGTLLASLKSWNMPTASCDGMMSSCSGLNDSEWRWIHVLKRPSSKAAVTKTPQSLPCAMSHPTLQWPLSNLRSPRPKVPSPYQRTQPSRSRTALDRY